MKTLTHLNVVFQLQDTDICKKKFDFEGTPLLLIERDFYYMNSRDCMRLCTVLAPNGDILPISFTHRQLYKSMVNQTLRFLISVKDRGINVHTDLTKQI